MSLTLSRRGFLAGVGAGAAVVAASTSFPRLARASMPLPWAFAQRYFRFHVGTYSGAPIAVDVQSDLTYQNPNFHAKTRVGPGGAITINLGPTHLNMLVHLDTAAVEKGDTSTARQWVASVVRGAFASPPTHLATSANQLIMGAHLGRMGPRHLAAVLSLVDHYGTSGQLTGYYDAKLDRARALKAWVKLNMGVYCSALVAHYARAGGFLRGPMEAPAAFVTTMQRRALSEIAAGDVIRFTGLSSIVDKDGNKKPASHVMLVEAIHAASGSSAEIVTVESCADGPYDGIVRVTSKIDHGSGPSFTWHRPVAGHAPNACVVGPVTSPAAALPEI